MCQHSTFWYYKHSEGDVSRNLTEGTGNIFLLHASLLRSTHLTTIRTFISEETFFISLLHILKKQFIALFKISFQKSREEYFGIPGPLHGCLIVIASKLPFINGECVRMTKGSWSYGCVHWPEETLFSRYLQQAVYTELFYHFVGVIR